MSRDKQEWLRPWAEGAADLPRGGSRPDTGADTGADAGAGAGSGAGAQGRATDWTSPWVESSVGTGASAASSPAAYRSAAPSTGFTPSSVPLSSLHDVEGREDREGLAPSSGSARGGSAAGPTGRRTGLLGGVIGGVVGAALMLATLGALGTIDLADLGAPGTGAGDAAPAPDSTVAPRPDAAPAPPSTGDPLGSVIPDMADRVLPTVVRINVSGSTDLTEANALGSGVIYRSDGYIITNHHVIENASAVEVLLADGDRLEAEIVGSDPLNDLAVLRIDREGLPTIDLRPTDEQLRVGETVVAIGSPFGLDATVTSGIISALNRDLRVPGSADVIPAVIQTDAAINPGNSGGALVDLQGRLVGINTAIMSRSGTNQGVGFAVAVRQAITSSDQLIAQGFVRYPLLGITGTDVTPQVAEAYGLDNRRGAVVDSVQPGSGADDAGMRSGDLIVAVDGVPLRSMGDLVAEVRRRAPGETVSFEVRRESQELRIDVVLGERPRS